LKVLKRNIWKVKKVFVPLHSQNEKAVAKQHWSFKKTASDFILIENKIWKLKKFSYLCTPNHKQGLQTTRNWAGNAVHMVTLNECNTRSLNDGNRQNSKYLLSLG
jgi:hypothetical protein